MSSDIESKVIKKIALLLNELQIKSDQNIELVSSLKCRIDGLLGKNNKFFHIEAIDFVILNKPQNMVEVYHLLNIFVMSDYIRIINHQISGSSITTHNALQEYIKISSKICDQYSKGMLALKMNRSQLPLFQKVENNTLNQVNITSKSNDSEVGKIEDKSNNNQEIYEIPIKKRKQTL